MMFCRARRLVWVVWETSNESETEPQSLQPVPSQAHSPRKQAIPTFPIATLRYTSTLALKAHK